MELIWNGKKEMIESINLDTDKKLVLDVNSSKDIENTGNLYIEGDNLDALKLLQNEYESKIKMIYIDPPYNTGKKFVYNDKFNTHDNWLNMMYPRLVLARKLLKDDGVIFISIDDNEVHNLRLICDEIFGESNFIGMFCWNKTETPSNLSKKIKNSLEYILCYEKKLSNNSFKGLSKKSNSNNGLMNQTNSEKSLIFPSDKIDTTMKNCVIKAGMYGTSSYKIELLKDCEVKDGYFITQVHLKGKFKWSQEKLDKEIYEKNTRVSIKTIALSPSYEKESYQAESPWDMINKRFGVKTNECANIEVKNLIGKNLFNYPKPVSLIVYLLNFVVDKDMIILDFFSGSSTTAHSVMKLNSEDGGNRKFIMVQLPEITDEKSEAYKSGYKNICEIGKERIRRAGDIIEGDIDRGFKVFKIEDNM